jgi:hypothetical protein
MKRHVRVKELMQKEGLRGEIAGVPLQAAAVYPGGLAGSGENVQSVRGRQRNSWFCFGK